MSLMISIDNAVSNNQWWKDLLRLFAKPGEYFEIHCWLDETEELRIAGEFGKIACYSMPDIRIVHGTLTDRLISILLNMSKPVDCECYNKMVPFFTIRIGDDFSSEKYGTEIILKSRTTFESEKVEKILSTISLVYGKLEIQ